MEYFNMFIQNNMWGAAIQIMRKNDIILDEPPENVRWMPGGRFLVALFNRCRWVPFSLLRLVRPDWPNMKRSLFVPHMDAITKLQGKICAPEDAGYLDGHDNIGTLQDHIDFVKSVKHNNHIINHYIDANIKNHHAQVCVALYTAYEDVMLPYLYLEDEWLYYFFRHTTLDAPKILFLLKLAGPKFREHCKMRGSPFMKVEHSCLLANQGYKLASAPGAINIDNGEECYVVAKGNMYKFCG